MDPHSRELFPQLDRRAIMGNPAGVLKKKREKRRKKLGKRLAEKENKVAKK
jgi:hypothetical protein